MFCYHRPVDRLTALQVCGDTPIVLWRSQLWKSHPGIAKFKSINCTCWTHIGWNSTFSLFPAKQTRKWAYLVLLIFLIRLKLWLAQNGFAFLFFFCSRPFPAFQPSTLSPQPALLLFIFFTLLFSSLTHTIYAQSYQASFTISHSTTESYSTQILT